MIAQVLRCLLSGAFICPIAYQTEYNLLLLPENRDLVAETMKTLGYRLARTNPDDGAYYMAPLDLTDLPITRVKEELSRFRDVFGPAVLLLDMIRQTNSVEIGLSPGDVIRLASLEEVIIESASLESQLRDLAPVIRNFNPRASIRDNLRRVLEQLRAAGYVALVNSQAEIYQVTGKIEYLYSVVEYIAEHEVIMVERVDDQVHDEQQVLDGIGDA
ncbi:condensin complex protein MksE [Cupriavidus plantarum]|uniref:condensin complex protein MksE n=1 Tax=Cupriavidus plantarum TaxID=942865 RepID=UPI000E2214B0|nr:hypothetical protein [Cupriavidus plantarum]REE93792.1 hypothetical protein C7418_2564 [Cupriavidus plantarum]